MSSRKRLFIFPSIVLIILLLTTILAGGIAAQGSVDEVLELSITKLSTEPVPVGEPAVFGVTLRNISGQGAPNIVMQLKWDEDAVSDVRMQIVTEETSGVRTDGVRRAAGMISWKGDMLADGVMNVEIGMAARSLCNNENVSLMLMGEAGRAGSAARIEASENITVTCAYDLNPNDLSVKMAIDKIPPLGVFGTEADVLAGQAAHTRIQVTNESDSRVNALIGVELSPEAGMEAQCLLLPAVQHRFSGAPTIPVVNSFFGVDTFTYSFMALEIDPGTTWQGDLRVLMRGREPGCEFNGEAVVYAGPAIPTPGSCEGVSPECRYQGWTPREPDVQELAANLPKWVSDPVTAALVSPDLGDAPASENHFNIGMPPYGADSGVANFPTVFNFNIGMPPTVNNVDMDVVGPYHREARPLRLGMLVSVERDADLNPGRNINPETGASNLDRRDDGLADIEMPGSCEPLTMPVQVMVEQWALDYFKDNGGKAYLNVFVDANGDGDWADAGKCGDETAPEHVVINHSMDMASAELGLFTVEMPANPGIMFETFRTWMRVSISEQPAPTPLSSGGIAHGDGRGPAGGYLLGETEDYRARIGNGTNAVDQGADLAVRMDGQITVLANPHMMGTPSLQATNWLTHTTAIFDHLIRFGNLGDTLAPGSKLVLLPDPALREGDTDWSVSGEMPWQDSLNYLVKCEAEDPDCRLEIDLGTIPPGKFGTVNVSVTANCTPTSGSVCKKTDLMAAAMVDSAADDSGSNNEAQKSWKLPLPAEWLAPPTIDFPIPGTTSNEELEIGGVAWPSRTVVVGVNGQKAGEDGDKDGPWKVTVAPKDGNYRIVASYDLPGEKLNPSPPVSVVMSGGSTMLVDPLSMRVGLQHGGSEYEAVPWDSSGRVDPSGWRLPLLDGAKTEISIEPSAWIGCLTCTLSLDALLPPLTATVMLPGDKLLTTLTVGEEDGILRGSFNADSSMLDKPVTLNVYFDGIEQIFTGSTTSVGNLSRVIDGTTGQPLVGAKVVLWQAAANSVVDGDDFLVWQRGTVVNGQPNPRVTGADGTFFFDVTPGMYRLEIIYDENAPSVWTDMRPAVGIMAGDEITIITGKASAATAKVTANEMVSISEDGFSPSFVTVSPGSAVEFQNLDLQDRGVQGTAETMVLLGITADHGDAPLLRSGSRMRIPFAQPGSYEFEDPQDPQNKMIVVVEPGGDNNVYLPVVMGK